VAEKTNARTRMLDLFDQVIRQDMPE
jgi:hypothetical protein